MRRQFANFDYILLVVVCLLTIFGILMIRSAVINDMGTEHVKQMIFFGLGLVLLLITAFIDYHLICSFYGLIYGVCVALLVGVLFVDSGDAGSVERWFKIGPFMLQPSEFAKIFLTIFFAGLCDRLKDDMKKPLSLLIFFITIALPVFLVLKQPSLSAALVLTFISLMILFVAGFDFKVIAFGFLALIPISFFTYKDILKYPNTTWVSKLFGEYQIKRMYAFFSNDNIEGILYQQIQSIKAIASGQLDGKGLFNGFLIQSSNVPYAENDFIFAVVGEEFGFIGSVIMLSLSFFIIVKCLYTAAHAPDLLGKLLVVGVSAMIGFQTFVNVCVSTGLMPNTGMPYPFVSYGGSSLWINMVSIGLVINVGMTKQKSFFEG